MFSTSNIFSTNNISTDIAAVSKECFPIPYYACIIYAVSSECVCSISRWGNLLKLLTVS